MKYSIKAETAMRDIYETDENYERVLSLYRENTKKFQEKAFIKITVDLDNLVEMEAFPLSTMPAKFLALTDVESMNTIPVIISIGEEIFFYLMDFTSMEVMINKMYFRFIKH